VKLARVRVAELATPVTAVVCDGALYDVGRLEAQSAAAFDSSDFFERVVASRGAGLEEVHARLLAGRRPTEARLLDREYLPLPPCDPGRSGYVHLAPSASRASMPRYQHRDARALQGDGQPIGVRTSTPVVAAGLGLVLGEDLESVGLIEAERAVLGWTLLLEWGHGERWNDEGPRPAAQLGPWLVFRPSLREVLGRRLVMRVGGRSFETETLDAHAFTAAESLAYLSHHVALRAGDVVGLAGALGGTVKVAPGERVSVELAGVMSLTGWAAQLPDASGWRER